MRIIVTGGTGLIGRALAAELLDAGHELVVLTRDPTRARGGANVRRVRWDGRTVEGWLDEMERADAVVNLAGENIGSWLWTARRKERIRDSRLWAGAAVVDAYRKTPHRPPVLIQSSGIGLYGDRGDAEVTESTSPGDDFLSQLGVEWERSTLPVEAMGVRRAVIRTAGVLSLQDGLLPKWLIPFRFFVGGPVGSGRQWLPWIHIADEARAIRFLIEHPDARGPFNATSPSPVTNAEFSRTLGRVLGRPSFMRVPAPILRLALGELGDLLLSGQRAFPRRLQELGFSFRFPDAEAALRDLLRSRPATRP